MDGLCSTTSHKTLSELFAVVAYKNQIIESHFDYDLVSLVDLLEKVHRKWQNESRERQHVSEQLSTVEREIEKRDSRMKTLEAQLKDARSQLAAQLTENSALKADLDDMERKFRLVQQLLKPDLESLTSNERQQLAFLKDSNVVRTHSRRLKNRQGYCDSSDESSDDHSQIDYDRTGDSFDMEDDYDENAQTRSGRVFRRSSAGIVQRRSQSAHPTGAAKRSRSKVFNDIAEEQQDEDLLPRKRSNRSKSKELVHTTEITTTTTVTVDPEGRTPSKAKVVIRRSMNRSMSESNLLLEKKENVARRNPMTPAMTTSTMDLRSPASALRGIASSWTKGQPIDTRKHRFEKLPSFFKITSCDVCNGGINFAAKPAIKCADCGQHVHVACKHRLPVPCVPRTPITQKTPSKSKLGNRLQDFCPPSAPMIPYPVIHCVVALEKGRLGFEGIYRVPGLKSQVSRLLDELKNARAVPKLELQDTEVITDCIKTFLRELRDPLIPKSSRDEFMKASLTGDVNALNVAICELPQPNRDTLAYLSVHWHRVAEQSELNRMPLENIARCVAPTVVGNGPITSKTDMTAAHAESKRQEAVMMSLLNMPSDYWHNLLSWQNPNRNGTMATRTPYSRPVQTPLVQQHCSPSAMDRSILGPVSTPAAAPMSRPVRRGRFFDDPC